MKFKFITVVIFVVTNLWAGWSSVSAQSDTVPAISLSAGVDVMSRYIWRGQEYGNAPSIQPGLSVSWKGFTLGAWGAYKITGPGSQETDYYLSKSIGFVTVAIWDYWNFSDSSSMDFFNYKARSTAHSLEAQVLLSGGETLPFNLLGSYFFWGSDKSRSIYLELQFLQSVGSINFQVFAGFQAKGDYYAPVPTFVNLGCTMIKTIEVTRRWTLPVSLSFIVNPYRRSAYIVAGITF